MTAPAAPIGTATTPAGADPAPRPLLVGEINPYGGDPAYALYPYPEHSAGGKLCRMVLGLAPGAYLKRFERRNLCAGTWRLPAARAAAAEVIHAAGSRVVILLGAKVCDAFGVEFSPFTWISLTSTVVLPHPSGRCRTWNEPRAVERAREALRLAGISVP